MPSVSKAQQAVMGMALAARRKEMKVSELSDAALKIYNSDMTDKQIEDFASTKKEGLPKHKMKTLKESILSSSKTGRYIVLDWIKSNITYSSTSEPKDLSNLIYLDKDWKICFEPYMRLCGDGKSYNLGDVTVNFDGERFPSYVKFGMCDVWGITFNCPNMTSTEGWPDVVTGQLVYGNTKVNKKELKEYNKKASIGCFTDSVILS